MMIESLNLEAVAEFLDVLQCNAVGHSVETFSAARGGQRSGQVQLQSSTWSWEPFRVLLKDTPALCDLEGHIT